MNKLKKTFSDIVERTRAKPIGSSDSFSGLCPSHDDNSASMSITMEDDRILLYCYTGCNIDDICLSLGIEQTDLFAHKNEKQINKEPVQLKIVKEQKRMKQKFCLRRAIFGVEHLQLAHLQLIQIVLKIMARLCQDLKLYLTMI